MKKTGEQPEPEYRLEGNGFSKNRNYPLWDQAPFNFSAPTFDYLNNSICNKKTGADCKKACRDEDDFFDGGKQCFLYWLFTMCLFRRILYFMELKKSVP